MKDITQLEIRAEYVNGAESGGLDNVILTRAAKSDAGTLFNTGLRSPHLPDGTTGNHGWGFIGAGHLPL